VENASTQNIVFEPLGVVQSSFEQLFGTPRQPGLVVSSKAKIKIHPKFQPEISLQGLSEFSHVWILFHFNFNESEKFHAKIHPPRLKGQSVGLFATRTPHRPNPIGLSVVKLESVEADGIVVSGVDLVNGTVVLDIKPYMKSVESIENCKEGWTQGLTDEKNRVEWESDFTQGDKPIDPRFKLLVEEILASDPRPQVYKGYEGGNSKYRSEHRMMIEGKDVVFEFVEKNLVKIKQIIFLN
jgi:tRNA (adenine37-N6)-methyltransferase